MKKYLLPFTLFLFGCNSLSINVPVPMVESPRAMDSKSRYELGIGDTPAMNIEVTSDASFRPPDLSKYKSDKRDYLFGDFKYSPISRLDMGASLMSAGSASTFMGELKWQCLGPVDGTPGGIPVALFVYSGASSSSNKGDQNGTFGAGGYNWEAAMNSNFYGGGVSVGYNINDSITVYIGGAKMNYSDKYKIDQKVSDNGSDPGGLYEGSFVSACENYSGGIELGKGFHVNLAYNSFHCSMDKAEDSNFGQFSGSLNWAL